MKSGFPTPFQHIYLFIFVCIRVVFRLLMEISITRDHYRPKTLNEAKKELNRLTSGFEKRLTKRVATFPEGEYVLITRCKTQDQRTGVMKQHIRAVGSGMLKDAVEKFWNELMDYYPTDDDEAMEEQEDENARANALLDMPRNAIKRATALRDMLRELWKLEGHSNTKQIYNAVSKGEDGFSWWLTEFPDIQFTNKAVESSDNSIRIYRVVAPKLYEKIVGCPPTVDAPEIPFVRCEKAHPITGAQQCSLRKNHRGMCNMRYMAPQIREEEPMEEEEEVQHSTDPQEFYTYLKRVGHHKEPFLHFSAGEIKQLGEHVKAGQTHLNAYRLMGLTVPRKYSNWYQKHNGGGMWADIKRKFPNYLDDYVLNPQEPVVTVVPREVVRREKKKKMKKSKTRMVLNSRQKNARKKMEQRNEANGYQLK